MKTKNMKKDCVDEFEKEWVTMQKGIDKLKRIFEGSPEEHFKGVEYIAMYTAVYNLCTKKINCFQKQDASSERVYEKYKEAFVDYIQSTVLPSIREKHGEYMLRELVLRWTNHNVMIRWLSRFFEYLDRFYVSRKSVPSLKTVGLCCFRDLVYDELKDKAQAAVVALIDQEREGEKIDRPLLKNVVDIFVEVGMGQMEYYETGFEGSMLNASAEYYSRKASSWIVEYSCPYYMIKTEECLKREKERVSHYLHIITEPKLVERVKNELLVVYCNQLLEKEHSGCRALLRDDKVDDLSRMYRLYWTIPKGLDSIAYNFKEHVTAEGTALVQQAVDAVANRKVEKNAVSSHDHAFIRNVIDLHDKYLAYVQNSFQGNSLFHKSLKDAFEVFCNKQLSGSTSAELLASYCDNLLKNGGSERLNDEELEDTLEKVVKVLAYINDKDLFAEFFRKKLSRRLLFDKSGNEHRFERSILTKLKQQCGGQFTSKMDGMITDLTLAKDNQTHFADYLSNNPNINPGLDLTVTVLTTGFWPTYKSSNLSLPSEMVKCVEVFKEFYQTKTKHRKLTWIYSLGTCNVNGRFGSKTTELLVGTYQAAALLLFNTVDMLSYSEIKTQLNLGDEDLVRVLHSLSCGKYKILNKTPTARTITQNDSFEFNSTFTDKMRRIRIPLPPVDERKKVVEDVDKDRRYSIDAAIVRIMKSRKVLSNQQLVMECVEQLNRMFKPDGKAIKKRIEDLISRDYLERDYQNPNMFKYLA